MRRVFGDVPTKARARDCSFCRVDIQAATLCVSKVRDALQTATPREVWQCGRVLFFLPHLSPNVR